MYVSKATLLRSRLLVWYRRHGRHDLPWRGTFDPYHVLVSEFMLQQTTVKTVIPYFRRFIGTFPSVEKLARAPLGRVLRQWAGLGYYARARRLHQTARIIVGKHEGRIPEDRSLVEGLPGVGPYTAGALLSFAYNKPEALVDGNVVRVLSRLWGLEEDARRPGVIKKLWDLAGELVPESGARHLNSALMDFGATVCTPGWPECGSCPLRRRCRAFALGKADSIPVSRPDKPKQKVSLTAFFVERGGRVALRRRPLGGLWGGLWELPMAEGSRNLSVLPLEKIGSTHHVLSHRDLKVELWRGRLTAGLKDVKWMTVERAGTSAISALTKKLLSMVDSRGDGTGRNSPRL